MKHLFQSARINGVERKQYHAILAPVIANGIPNDLGKERARMLDTRPLKGFYASEQRFLGQILQYRDCHTRGHHPYGGLSKGRRENRFGGMGCHSCFSFSPSFVKWKVSFPGAAVPPFAKNENCPLDAEPPGK